MERTVDDPNGSIDLSSERNKIRPSFVNPAEARREQARATISAFLAISTACKQEDFPLISTEM
jgi:hypothetical protein